MQIVCEIIISDLLKPSPSSAALAFIKNEVSELWWKLF
jgi:hypothetical protein